MHNENHQNGAAMDQSHLGGRHRRALLTTAWLPWTSLISLYPGHLLYDREMEVQLYMAALLGITAAGLTYFVLRKFFATLVLALMAFPALAAVATKAANIASREECDASVYRKFKESFDEALDAKNVAELSLWTIAWASGGLGVFFLVKAIDMW